VHKNILRQNNTNLNTTGGRPFLCFTKIPSRHAPMNMSLPWLSCKKLQKVMQIQKKAFESKVTWEATTLTILGEKRNDVGFGVYLFLAGSNPFLWEKKQLRQRSKHRLPLQDRSLHRSPPFSLLLAYITFPHQEE